MGGISFSSFPQSPAMLEALESVSARLGIDDLEPGRVVRVDRTLPLVSCARGSVRAEHAAALVKGSDTLAAVGDWVALDFPGDHDNAVIRAILPRVNSLSRADRSRKSGRQTLAANIDMVFIVTPMDGIETRLGHLERELVISYQSHAKPAIVLSKMDACANPSSAIEAVRRIVLDAPVVAESIVDGSGVSEIASLVEAGEVAVLLGKSGVGKSSLVNAIIGEDVLQTGAVRARDGKGRHTTIARRMVQLPNGGFIIDAPGLRSFVLTGSETGVREAFADIFDLAAGCRFRDCAHESEPGCAVQEAIEAGVLERRRFESYKAIAAEVAERSQRKMR